MVEDGILDCLEKNTEKEPNFNKKVKNNHE